MDYKEEVEIKRAPRAVAPVLAAITDSCLGLQELELRLPVLSALGLLSIDPTAGEKVLHTALESIASLSESELAPAVGLVLKLASEATFSRPAAVHSVRRRVTSRPEVRIFLSWGARICLHLNSISVSRLQDLLVYRHLSVQSWRMRYC